MRSPLSLLLPKLDKPRVLSRSSQDRPPALSPALLPPLDTFEYLNTLLNLWGPELHSVLKVRPHQHWTERDNHLFCPPGSAVFDAPRDAVWPPGCQGTLLAPIEPAVDQPPQLPFCRAALQPLLAQLIIVPTVTPPRIWHSDLFNVIPLIVAQCSNLSRSLCKSQARTSPDSQDLWCRHLYMHLCTCVTQPFSWALKLLQNLRVPVGL